MRFLCQLLLVVCLIGPFTLALSEEATRFYKQLSVLKDKLEENRKAIDRYNGGTLSSSPLGATAYELWSALRIGNIQLREATENSTICPPDERHDIMQAIHNFGLDGVQTMKVYQEKQPLLQASRTGFAVPLFLDALLREIEDSELYSRGLLGHEYDDQVTQSYGLFRKEWTSVFEAYTEDLTPELGFAQHYRGFIRTMQPVFNMLF
ncbi:hypothetical protein N7528_003106 [Penicillium herquei]|nr:hypothetical protein N7528_003106 [Penicillium herquei]